MAEIKWFVNTFWWLDNSYEVNIFFEGITYPSVTHAFLASQTTDRNFRNGVSVTSLGQLHQLTPFIQQPHPEWNQTKVMKELLEKKFGYEVSGHNPKASSLMKRLVSTGDSDIVYGNWHHGNFWGKCFCGECEADAIPSKNVLGGLLMGVRARVCRAIVNMNDLTELCPCDNVPEAWFLYTQGPVPKLRPFCLKCQAAVGQLAHAESRMGGVVRFEKHWIPTEGSVTRREKHEADRLRKQDLQQIRTHFPGPYPTQQQMMNWATSHPQDERKFESKVLRLSGNVK